MNLYQKINNLTGFLLFFLSGIIFWLTMEPTVSFWDCGEFIAASYKLQVGHQPGAPLFLMIGKLFSLLAIGNTAKIAYWVNFSSVIFSAATVMFLYWTITMFASKLYAIVKSKPEITSIIITGVVGSLAFAFSDTFWFSAVEAEVYSLSILFTAIVFWSILKWENNMDNRWLVLISFIIGLSIGVHLLSLLAIPAVVLVYYFKKTNKPSFFGVTKALVVSGIIWLGVQYIIIQSLVLLAAKFDIVFVNSFGLSFGTGAIFFLLVLFGAISYGIFYSIKKNKYYLNLGMVCLTFVVFGFSSYFLIIIRANAKTTLNLSNPDNALSLYNYLGRTNYGETPLLYGQTFDAELLDYSDKGTEYRKGKDKYEESGKLQKPRYSKNMIFPRVHSHKSNHPEFYRHWLNLANGESPNFFQNLKFFTSWQMGYMYWRYFFWNFAGRLDDNHGYGLSNDGAWLTGIKSIDALRLGSQDKLPPSITENEGNNKLYGLPLVLGILGLLFLYRKNKNDAIIITVLFFFTGLAIILYLNQDPMQVRERDYAYVGSFYAFAIFIGFGVLSIQQIISRLNAPKLEITLATAIGLLAAPVLMSYQGWDEHNRSKKTTALDWAKNYLNSCAPNAILFTNADNDTFPLWYVQEVENFRTDVRVVNIQYLSDGDYINQMKKQSGKSAPLPINVPSEKYVKGVRDWMPYVDYGFTDSVDLKDILAVLTSDNRDDKMPMSDGGYENFLPTKKFKLIVDADQVIKTKTLDASRKNAIVSEMEWNYQENMVLKAKLAIFDILVNNNWERPIYFGTSISEDSYIGLDKYLYLEGYAFRLLPLKAAGTFGKINKEAQTNSDVMYANMMNKIDLKGFKTTKYLDPESRRIAIGTTKFINTLAANLQSEGKSDKAKKLLLKAVTDLPEKNYSIEDTLYKVPLIQNLYNVKENLKANTIAKQSIDFLDKELDYFASLDPKQWNNYGYEIETSFRILGLLEKLTRENGQQALNRSLKDTLDKFQSKFI